MHILANILLGVHSGCIAQGAGREACIYSRRQSPEKSLLRIYMYTVVPEPRPSLVPSPTPSFSSLAVPYCKRQKAGRGTGNEATLGPQFSSLDRYGTPNMEGKGGGGGVNSTWKFCCISEGACTNRNYLSHSAINLLAFRNGAYIHNRIFTPVGGRNCFQLA